MKKPAARVQLKKSRASSPKETANTVTDEVRKKLLMIELEQSHKQLQFCAESIRSSNDFVDKAVMTTSLGAITLSITLVDKFSHAAEHLCALKTAWLFLGAAFVTTIISAFVSQREHRELCAHLYFSILKSYNEILGYDAEISGYSQPPQSAITGWLNIVAAVLMIVGLMSLAYVALNGVQSK